MGAGVHGAAARYDGWSAFFSSSTLAAGSFHGRHCDALQRGPSKPDVIRLLVLGEV